MSNLPVNRCNSASNSQQGDPRSTATLVLPEARSAFNIATDAVCRGQVYSEAIGGAAKFITSCVRRACNANDKT
jgi:hypothetical protein